MESIVIVVANRVVVFKYDPKLLPRYCIINKVPDRFLSISQVGVDWMPDVLAPQEKLPYFLNSLLKSPK
jgi:hypothetical protein